MKKTSFFGVRSRRIPWNNIDHALALHEFVPIGGDQTVPSTAVLVVLKPPNKDIKFSPYHHGRTRFIQELERRGIPVHHEGGDPHQAVHGITPLDINPTESRT